MSAANTFGTPDNTLGTLNGLFKERYADKMENLIPENTVLLPMIDFLPKDKQLGNLYNQPVILGMEHGVTFAGPDDDAFNLEPAVAGQIKNATVRGNPALLRSLIGYTALSRSTSSEAAFESATKFVVANMLRSMAKIIEIELLYGQMGYATAASATGSAVTITTAEWAPGIWAGAEKMPIEIRNAAGTVSRGNFNVVSVNMDTRVLTLDADAAAAGVVSTDVIWRKGAYGNEFVGIHKILSTTTGELFGISVDQYNLFRSNQYPAGSAALSFAKLQAATARAVEKGLDSALTAVISTRAWTNLLTDQAALRQYDGSYSSVELENGSKALKFHSQNGTIEIKPSVFVKEGYAYLLSKEDWCRVGSSDLTFKLPGEENRFFRQLENSAGYELRLWTDQAVFTYRPGAQVLISGIVNS